MAEDYWGSLRAYHNYNFKLNNKDKEPRIPKALNPNLLLAGLFRNEEVDPRLANYLASILEKFAAKNVLAQIASDHVKRAVKGIDDINDA